MTTTRRLNDSNKVIVTAALTGAVTTKQDNPYLPTQPKEIAEAALRHWLPGAAQPDLLRRTGVLLGGAYPPLPGAQTRDGVF